MLVIRRNGKTVVYTGWRAWLIGFAALLVAWFVFALIAAVFVGVALSIGVLMLLLVPAVAVVALVRSMMGG
jgi:hypothetical protein